MHLCVCYCMLVWVLGFEYCYVIVNNCVYVFIRYSDGVCCYACVRVYM